MDNKPSPTMDTSTVDKKEASPELYKTSLPILQCIPDVTIRPYYYKSKHITITCGNSTTHNDAPVTESHPAEIFRIDKSSDPCKLWAEQQLVFKCNENCALVNKNCELSNKNQQLENKVIELESRIFKKTDELAAKELKYFHGICLTKAKLKRVTNDKLELETLFKQKCEDFEELRFAYNNTKSNSDLIETDEDQKLSNFKSLLSVEQLKYREEVDELNQKIQTLQDRVRSLKIYIGSLEDCVSTLEVELSESMEKSENMKKELSLVKADRDQLHDLLNDPTANVDQAKKFYHRTFAEMEERQKSEIEQLKKEQQAEIEKLKKKQEVEIEKLKMQQVAELQRLTLTINAIRKHLNQKAASTSRCAVTKRKACDPELQDNLPNKQLNGSLAEEEKKLVEKDAPAPKDVEVITLSDSDE